MSDVGPGPPELILKRLTRECKRLEFSIENQELELMEMEDRRSRLQQNIKSSKDSLNEAREMLEHTRKEYEVKTNG